MAYVFFNPNPLGKKVGDCVIRAISKLTRQDWRTVYLDIAMAGYELCDMPSSNNVWAAYLKKLGYRRHVIPDTCPTCYTIRDFCFDNPRGKFLLATGLGAISVAITIDGSTIPASTMTVTPAAVEEFYNVSRAINAGIFAGCCESIAVRNTSDQPILVQNANIIISRPDLAVTR